MSNFILWSLHLDKKYFLTASRDVPENVLVREVLYVLQGIEGGIIKYDRVQDCYKVDPTVSSYNTHNKTVL